MSLSRVDFFALRFDPKHRSPVLFLKDAERDKFLPVWIGETEATSIELAATRERAPRPLTHDLFSRLLRSTGVQLVRAVIDRIEARTYYASLHFEFDGEPLVLDCRPSDAVALALREDVRIYVDEDLMYNIKFVELSEAQLADEDEESLSFEEDSFAGDDDSEQAVSEDSFQDFLRNISPTDFRDS